jgi:DNA-binding MarR family transcriptional regulator
MAPLSTSELLAARVRLPQHVVHRSFVAETVVLNLHTGQYHGLNPTAGRMLEALDAAPTASTAVVELAREYGVEPGQIENDLTTLCQGLLERGLIEIVDADPV